MTWGHKRLLACGVGVEYLYRISSNKCSLPNNSAPLNPNPCHFSLFGLKDAVYNLFITIASLKLTCGYVVA